MCWCGTSNIRRAKMHKGINLCMLSAVHVRPSHVQATTNSSAYTDSTEFRAFAESAFITGTACEDKGGKCAKALKNSLHARFGDEPALHFESLLEARCRLQLCRRKWEGTHAPWVAVLSKLSLGAKLPNIFTSTYNALPLRKMNPVRILTSISNINEIRSVISPRSSIRLVLVPAADTLAIIHGEGSFLKRLCRSDSVVVLVVWRIKVETGFNVTSNLVSKHLSTSLLSYTHFTLSFKSCLVTNRRIFTMESLLNKIYKKKAQGSSGANAQAQSSKGASAGIGLDRIEIDLLSC